MPRATVLAQDFYDRDPRQVGPDLLGKILVRREARTRLEARIVEVEAYLGADDPAAHAFSGRTERNSVLFGPPGRAYIYFIYGNHYCLNFSCLADGVPGGVLVRSLEPLQGIRAMALARHLEITGPRDLRLLTSGPGRLAEAFGITRLRDNGKDVTNPRSDLRVMEDGFRPVRVVTTARIGIRKAADLPLRYLIADSEFVSGTRRGNSADLNPLGLPT